MVASTTPHPDREELLAYGQGLLAPETAAAIEQPWRPAIAVAAMSRMLR